jgi:hypothetical protein
MLVQIYRRLYESVHLNHKNDNYLSKEGVYTLSNYRFSWTVQLDN